MTSTSDGTAEATTGRRGALVAGWNFTTVEVALVVLAGGLGLLADQFSWSFLTLWAQFFGGMLLAVLGIEQIVTRLDVYRGAWSYAQVVEIYKTLVVQLWGLILLGLGLFISLGSILSWTNPRAGSSIWDGLLNSTTVIGLVLAGVGLLTALHGLIRALAGRSDADQPKITGLMDALYRLAGVLTVVFGLALSLAALFVVLAPDMVSRLIASLGALLVGP